MSDRRDDERRRGSRGGDSGRKRRGGRRRPPVDDRVRELSGPLGGVLGRLPQMERRVLELRMGLTDGHPRNITETARELGMTPGEAKQIELRAFERIREVVPLDKLQRYLGDG